MEDTAVSIISQGLDLMLYGMGTVIVFLTLMVFVLLLLAQLVKAFPGTEEPELNAMGTAQPAAEAIDPVHRKAIEQAMKLLHQK